MAATYVQIQEFCPENESIEAYLEHIELYFTANNIVAEWQVAVFLTIIGGNNYALLRNLLSPAKPSGTTLAKLTAALQWGMGCLSRSTLRWRDCMVIAERFRFYRREKAIRRPFWEIVLVTNMFSTEGISEGCNKIAISILRHHVV